MGARQSAAAGGGGGGGDASVFAQCLRMYVCVVPVGDFDARAELNCRFLDNMTMPNRNIVQ